LKFDTTVRRDYVFNGIGGEHVVFGGKLIGMGVYRELLRELDCDAAGITTGNGLESIESQSLEHAPNVKHQNVYMILS